MSQHLIRFSKPKEDRSKFVNDVLAKSVGKTEAQIINTAEKLGLNPGGQCLSTHRRSPLRQFPKE